MPTNYIYVILFSSGIDSTVLTYHILNKCIREKLENCKVYLLHFQYGQKCEEAELQRCLKIFEKIKKEFGNFIEINFQTIKFPLNEIFNPTFSKLLKVKELREIDLTRFGISNWYVPQRNLLFIVNTYAWIENLVINEWSMNKENKYKIYISLGVHKYETIGYPDTTPIFLDKLEEVIEKVSLINWLNIGNVSIYTPFVNMYKWEIVKLGHELKVPFELTWSCYERNDIPCMKCFGCTKRKEAFQKAGIPDPLLKYT